VELTFARHSDYNAFFRMETHLLFSLPFLKASKTLGFLRRNLGRCTTKTKATAYTTLVRPVLEYASPVWDSHQITTTRDIDNAFFRMETHLLFSLPFF
jgi:hypothetical protein